MSHREAVRGTATVTPNTFTTVATHTPTNQITTTGIGADVAGLTSVTYRYQLVVDGVIKHEESIMASDNSWVPIEVRVASGLVVEVKLRHGEIADQACTATIAYGY